MPERMPPGEAEFAPGATRLAAAVVVDRIAAQAGRRTISSTMKRSNLESRVVPR
jgi:hypothetical protein